MDGYDALSFGATALGVLWLLKARPQIERLQRMEQKAWKAPPLSAWQGKDQ